MCIVDLTTKSKVKCFRRGTDCALMPDGDEFVWSWKTLMDTGIDIVYYLDEISYIGDVEIALRDGSGIYSAEILCDCVCSGRYDAETGKTIGGTFRISVGVAAQKVTVRLNACLMDIAVEDIVICGAQDDGPLLYPTPESASYGNDMIPLREISGISGDMTNSDIAFVAEYLEERIGEYYTGVFSGGGSVAIALLIDDSIPFDGYHLVVKSRGITISAASRRALLYGCEAFFSLITGGTIPTCEISDKPFKEMRGFHMMLPPRDQLEFAKRVFRYVLLPMRYNQIFLEFAGGMRFDRHPEISEGWLQGNKAAADGLQPKFPHGTVAGGGLLEKDEVRDLVEYAKSLGFEVIPEVQSFGHVQYITYAHPEIAEIDEDLDNEIHDTRALDQPPDVFYYHSYCPMHDKSYEIIYDIIDEIVEVVKPERYVHMGHDEIYQIGLCSRCKDKNHAELYAKHVNRMYNYLKQKGLKMCIWSDMLQPTEKRYQTSPARTMIPKDILMLDFIWYFHFDLDMEDHILPYDFNVIVGNLYSSHYPRFETRIKKDHMLGGQVSTWCLFDEYNLAKKGKIFDIMYTAEMLWNSNYTSLARPVYNRVIGELIPSVRDELRGEIIRDDFIEEYNHIVLDGDDILPYEIYLAAESYDGELFNTDIPILADNYTINVSSTYDRLVFLHTTLNNDRRTAWEPLERVGSYIVNYLDGTREEIPIEYAGNICVWSRRYAEPLPQQYYRHQGYIATYFSDPIIETKTQDGRDITVLGFTWLNKYPEKVISNIVCVSSDKTDAKPILLALSGINVKKING